MRIRETFDTDGALFNIARALWTRLGLPKPHPPLSEFAPDGGERVKPGSRPPGDFAGLFFEHQGRHADKWLHYFSIYDQYLAKYRGNPVTMLEIGVSRGGSLELWRKYLGESARIMGIDIDPACADRVNPPNEVLIGSQADPRFLESVIAWIGPPDIILDDGSHMARHQITSFDTLFPHLRTGGVYIVEDVHTAYWPEFYDLAPWRTRTFMKHVHRMIDDMHGWYHYRKTHTSSQREVSAVHVHDSMVIIEKSPRDRPRQIVAPGSRRPAVE